MKQPGPVIVACESDQASFNIARNLIQKHGFKQGEDTAGLQVYEQANVTLAVTNKECIYLQPQDIPLKANSIIFASKHRSNTNTPALTVHATGNLTNEALYGGNPEEVSLVEPSGIYTALTHLAHRVERAGIQIEVTMEATHHGPTNFPVPVCFIEIGSQPKEWTDPALGEIAAAAIMTSATTNPHDKTVAVGFGGTHYPAKCTRVCQEGSYFIGHIVSKYALEAQPEDRVLLDTFKKTMGECKTAVIDWKGLKGEQRRGLLDKLSSWGIEPVRV